MMNISGANENKYFIGLSLLPGVGCRTLLKLIEYFGSAEKAWKASIKEMEKLQLRKDIKESLTRNRIQIDIERKFQDIINQNVKLLNILDPKYPILLKEIYDPPILLYYKGELDWNNSLFFGVVGTRKITSYGIRAIEEIVGALTLHGLVIVSGMAKGGDTIAHQAAVKSGGKTVGVLGSGVNIIYPPENKKLSEEIIKNGAILSEFPPDAEPRRQNFPLRNRLISGLSLGLLVVEASEKSGTLITANCALDQNREVFALPGSIFNPYSKGPAKLIKMGAKMVTSVEDILEELNLEGRQQSKRAQQILPDSKEEEKILSILNLHDYVMIDELIRETKLSSPVVLSSLTLMEMKGKVRNLGGGKYGRKG